MTTPSPPADPTVDPTTAWVARHQVGAWRYLCFLGGERSWLEDILQDALLAAVEKGIPDRPDRVAAAWLRSTVHNLFLMGLRRRRIQPALRELTDEASAEAAFASFAGRDGTGSGMVAALRACYERIAPRSQRAVDRFYGDGCRRDQLAAELGLSVEGVKTLLRRAKAELRACVESKRGEWS